MRKFSISLTLALVLLAMLWGNCLSCPELVASAHSCCHKPQPASAGCHTQNLQNFVKAEKAAPVVAVVVDIPLPVAPPQASLFRPVVSQLTPLDLSTPPLNLRV